MLRPLLVTIVALTATSCFAQRFSHILLQFNSAEPPSASYKIPVELMFQQVGIARPTRVNGEMVVAEQAGAIIPVPSMDWGRIESVSVRLLEAEGVPTRYMGSRARLIPVVSVPGMADVSSLRTVISSVTGRADKLNQVFGYPLFRHTIEDSVEFSTRTPLVFRFSRSDRPPATAFVNINVSSRMADGARNDSAFTSFLETYNGQLIPLNLQFRDGQSTSRNVGLRRAMVPSDYKRCHFFMSRANFATGAPMPAASAFEGGDDMRFSLNLGISGVRNMPSIDIKDRASVSLGPAPAQTQVAEPLLATHLAVWMETAEKKLHETLEPQLIFDLVGGRVITMSVKEGLNPRQAPGRNPYDVFARVLRIPQSGINGEKLGVPLAGGDKLAEDEPPLDGIPIHAIKKVTLRLKINGNVPEGQQEWDLKSLIISASRESRFNLHQSVDWVPLYVNAGLNKRFRASVNTGRTNDRMLEIPINLSHESYEVVRRPGS